MKLIALAIFLLSISSNALAIVETWECDGDYYKIDTDIPTVYIRKNSRWIDISNPSELIDAFGDDPEAGFDYMTFKYSYKDESVYWIMPYTKEYIGVMDLVTKELFAINNGEYELEHTCKLY